MGSADEDTSFTFTAEQLLTNASDVDGDQLSVVNLRVTEGEGAITDNKMGHGNSHQNQTGVAKLNSAIKSLTNHKNLIDMKLLK